MLPSSSTTPSNCATAFGTSAASALGNAPIRSRAGRGQLAELGLGEREALRDRVGVREQDLAGAREPEPARLAVEQPRADLALERRDLLRDRRLGERERARRLRERALVGDRAEGEHAPRIHRQQLIGLRKTII